jgi:hypothetical protein
MKLVCYKKKKKKWRCKQNRKKHLFLQKKKRKEKKEAFIFDAHRESLIKEVTSYNKNG